MKKLLFAIGMLVFASSATAQTIGTKFVCCAAESTSGLGSGGCTRYTPVLRDRALTQVDAIARCTAVQAPLGMHWKTHSCPSSKCSPSSISEPKPTTYTFRFHNACNKEVKILTSDMRPGDKSPKPRGYFFAKPGTTITAVSNNISPVIQYWAQTVDKSFTWEGDKYSSSGRKIDPINIYNNSHYMIPAVSAKTQYTNTVHLRCR